MNARYLVAAYLLSLTLCACGSCARNAGPPSTPTTLPSASAPSTSAAPARNSARESALAEIRRSPLAGLADRIAAELSPTVALEPSCLEPPEPGLGESRLGGMPDVPEGFAWPSHAGRPLAFLAQIRLKDAAAHDESGLLPKAGWLLVFYDYRDQPWGSDPGDQAAHEVLFVPPDKLVRRAAKPAGLPNEEVFPRCRLSFRSALTLPDIETAPWLDELLARGKPMKEFAVGTRAEWLGEQRLAYKKLRDRLVDSGENRDPEIHQLLGREASIQGPVREECEQLPENERRGAKDFRLLLQLDSHIVPAFNASGKKTARHDEEGEWLWGDVGRLYFMVSEKDLRKADFSHICVILQCY